MLTYTFESSFEPLASELRTLWLRAKSSLFLHPDYQLLWWRHEGKGQLKLLCIWQAKKLVGFLPLFSSDQKEWRIVGAMDLSDYLGILFVPELKAEIFEQVLAAFRTLSQQTIRLECLQSDSAILSDLVPLLQNNKFKVTQTQQDVCPGFSLPTSMEKYFSSLEPKQAKTFQRNLRNIGEDDEIAFRCLTKPEEVSLAMPTFIKLHKASETNKNAFWTPKREAFFTEMATALAKDDLVRLCFLDVNGDPAATILVFDYLNQFLAYNSGFDAYRHGYLGVGNVILLHSIEDAIKLGRSYYDFMRGDEAYKFLFGAQSQPLFDLRITQ